MRSFLEQWWFDTSAKALGENYRDFTFPINVNGNLKVMDYSQILPGDLAVTKNGVHVLVYVGNDKWIQADPGEGKVLTLNARTEDNIWFDSDVSIHRWNFFKAL